MLACRVQGRGPPHLTTTPSAPKQKPHTHLYVVPPLVAVQRVVDVGGDHDCLEPLVRQRGEAPAQLLLELRHSAPVEGRAGGAAGVVVAVVFDGEVVALRGGCWKDAGGGRVCILGLSQLRSADYTQLQSASHPIQLPKLTQPIGIQLCVITTLMLLLPALRALLPTCAHQLLTRPFWRGT